MRAPVRTPRRLYGRARVGWPLSAVAVLLAVAGCSGVHSGGSSSSAADTAGSDVGSARDAVGAPSKSEAGAGQAPQPSDVNGGAGQRVSAQSSSQVDPSLIGRSLIRTGSVSLRSGDISSVLAKIDQLIARDGGFIASETTSTDTHGVAVRSSVELAVPVSDFGAAYDEVASYGDLVSRSSSTRDVTAQVVDVDSRVKSAHDSIAQLRLLFSRATKLGDVIALEDELSQREADLEALQSEQRDLRSHTTMSTISVDITSSAATSPVHHDRAGGFLSGIRQGWHGLVTFVVESAHVVGLVLPLGSLALLAALAGWVAVRRFTPRRPPRTSE
ncbi:MAG: hypothetical protein QOC98_285 [Frankiaceae bacterium]|nr:hypothetical protein [Frankiaceae bacterium]